MYNFGGVAVNLVQDLGNPYPIHKQFSLHSAALEVVTSYIQVGSKKCSLHPGPH